MVSATYKVNASGNDLLPRSRSIKCRVAITGRQLQVLVRAMASR